MDAGTQLDPSIPGSSAEAAADTLHAEVADALARGLVTPAEVAGIDDAELAALAWLARAAYDRGDGPLAQTLACAQVVLAPYSAPSWSLLAEILQADGQVLRATLARRAVALLSPSPPPATEARDPGEPTPTAAASDGADAGEGSQRRELTLTDGRILPLRTTPAAQHHDTVAARRSHPTILSGSAWVDAVQWATRTWEGPGRAGAEPKATTTQTSIVRRPEARAASPQSKADPPPVPPTQTDVIPARARADARTDIQASAASRRLGGWPMTDEITLTVVPPHPKPGRKAP